MTVVQNTAVFSEDNPDSSHPHCKTSFPSPCAPGPRLGATCPPASQKAWRELSTTNSTFCHIQSTKSSCRSISSPHKDPIKNQQHRNFKIIHSERHQQSLQQLIWTYVKYRDESKLRRGGTFQEQQALLVSLATATNCFHVMLQIDTLTLTSQPKLLLRTAKCEPSSTKKQQHFKQSKEQ